MDLHIKRKGITLKIDYDYSYNPNPREDDNLGVMACYHTRYSLGDENVPKTYSDFKEWYNSHKEDVYCMLPVYLLDHSGLRMSVIDFKDPWDSGQVGFIYCTKEAIEKAGIKEYDKHSIGKILKAEVDSYKTEICKFLCKLDNFKFIIVTDCNIHAVTLAEVHSEACGNHTLEKCFGEVFTDTEDFTR